MMIVTNIHMSPIIVRSALKATNKSISRLIAIINSHSRREEIPSKNFKRLPISFSRKEIRDNGLILKESSLGSSHW